MLKIGKFYENKALVFLMNNGLKLIKKNYYCCFGEIDLIMKDGNILVFIEVRYRKSSKYSDPIESIDGSKQKKLLKSAAQYLKRYNLFDKIDCRFDVIGISDNKLNWIKDAFSYE